MTDYKIWECTMFFGSIDCFLQLAPRVFQVFIMEPFSSSGLGSS